MSNSLGKKDVVDSVSDKTGLTKDMAAKAIEAFLGTISDSLAQGDSVRMVGFGTFSPAESKARKGRNPKTGDELDIPASVRAKFSMGKTLKTALNDK